MYHSVEDVKEIFHELREEHPELEKDLVCHYIENMPNRAYESFVPYMHITSPAKYKKAVSYLTWKDNKGSADKWSVDELVRLSGIDFNTKSYTVYDFAYWVNMLYSDHLNVVGPEVYIAMAIDDLEDHDYMGDPSTRAYSNANKRIKYHLK